MVRNACHGSSCLTGVSRDFRRVTGTTFLVAAALWLCGCATAGKALVTPLTVVRDVVDAPLVTIANATEGWARASNPRPVPQASGGWTIFGGFNAGIGLNLSYYLFKGVSGIFGGVDYVICRSIWPNFPKGINPWKRPEESWGSLYFPNTRVLWDENYQPPGMDTYRRDKSPPTEPE